MHFSHTSSPSISNGHKCTRDFFYDFYPILYVAFEQKQRPFHVPHQKIKKMKKKKNRCKEEIRLADPCPTT